MRKSFPVPKGLRSPSFASRYAKLRKLRKLAGRKKSEHRDSGLVFPNEPFNLPKANRHTGIPFGSALLIAFVLFGTLLVWLHFSG